ncbi:hypothetical protein LTR53_003323 [Teratosphaeriaceae sp. CCFEE 6253]|nr:hypothetical protein LTR53_003323 [Teratosphaeriaceae sp. CCFEE 6253]
MPPSRESERDAGKRASSVMPAALERFVVTRALLVVPVGPADRVGSSPPLKDITASTAHSLSVCRTSTTQSNEPRSRVIISKEYEKKIDRIEDRLVRIEALLQRQVAAGAQPPISTSTALDIATFPTVPAAETGASHPSSTKTTDFDDSMTLDVREATMESQSVAASKLVEQAIGNSPGTYENHELAAALNSLRQMVGGIDTLSTESLGFSEGQPYANAPAEPPTAAELGHIVQRAACRRSQ